MYIEILMPSCNLVPYLIKLYHSIDSENLISELSGSKVYTTIRNG